MLKLQTFIALFILCLSISSKLVPYNSISHKQETTVTDDGSASSSNEATNTSSSPSSTSTQTSDASTQTNTESNTDTTSSNEKTPEDKQSIQITKKLYPALGYDLKEGPLWSVVCLTKDWGRIPGKLDLNGHAFYTYDYSIYYCDKFFKVNGKLVWNDGKVPENCLARGKQNDNSKPLYNVIAVTQYGNIPGKASSPLEATFSVEAIRHSTKTFYWIC